MQRLLGILRQSQAYCSDSSCVDDFSPVPQGSNDTLPAAYMAMFFAILAIIGAIVFGLPRRQSADGKPRGSSGGRDPEPPAIY